MAKKKKRRLQTPSLSPFDKGLYILLDILSIAFAAFGFPIILGTCRRTVFQDPHVLAQSNGSWPLLFPWMVPGIFLLCLFLTLSQKKQPIFGKSGVQYGPPRWKPVYPVFSRAFWKHHRKKVFPVLAGALALVIALCAVTALVLPIRTCLYDDGSIVSYNWHNEAEHRCAATDITEIRIYTDTIHRKGIDDRTFGIQLTTTQGNAYRFLYSEFRHDDLEIRNLIRLKALLSHAVFHVDGAEYLPAVIKDQNLTPEEADLLYELFENPPETR